jgi:hypothetical protein
MGKRVSIVSAADGRWPTVSLPTGDSHTIVLTLPRLKLERRYHDDAPVHAAPFTVELSDGSYVDGTLDESGAAQLEDLHARPKRVRFGADGRSYERVDQRENPHYRAERNAAELDALVRRSLAKP